METRLPARTWELPRRWERLGRSILEAREIDPDYYQRKTVKERLMDAMAVRNIGALLENASELDGLDSDEVLDRMVLDRTTKNRWQQESFQPHPRNFFGLLVVGLRREIEDVALPRSRTIIWDSVRRTIANIGEKELKRAWCHPKPEEFACVRSLMRHPHADQLVPPPKPGDADWEGDRYVRPSDPVLVDQVLTYLLKNSRLTSASEVLAVIKEWAEPYVLFRLGLLWEWRFLDEHAV